MTNNKGKSPITPHIPPTNGPPSSKKKPASDFPRPDPKAADKLATIRSQLDDTTAVASAAVSSALERGEALDSLAARTSRLAEQTAQFEKHAEQTSKKHWFKEKKGMLVIFGGLVLVVGAALIYVLMYLKSGGSGT